ILEKKKIFGDSKRQINALTSFVVALIFVGFVLPKAIITNLILYFSVALVIILVFMILYGMVSSDSKDGFKPEKWMKWVFGILIAVSLIIAIFWASGSLDFIINLLFYQSWSKTVWANVLFIVLIAGAVAFAFAGGKKD
ncbi:MAG: hypothetical protein AABY22_24275, partial [Nanoarchaeota archaeon]